MAPYYATMRTDSRSLRRMVEGFVAVDAAVLDEEERTALAEKILLRWAGAEGVVAAIV